VIANASGKAIDLGDGNDTLNITGSTIQGDISGGSGTNTCTIDPRARNFIYTGRISNFNSVEIKSGVVTFSGASTYTGTTKISGGGTLIAANSKGSATGSGDVRVTEGTLGGKGSIGGRVTIDKGSSSATLAPGTDAQQEARLAILGTLAFKNGATYLYTFKASGNNSMTDEVVANGVTIADRTTLTVHGEIDGRLHVGTTFTVISNKAATPIAGTFANLADGSIITINGNNLRASYEGGDDNDLTLTVVQ
jgi:autotransporter-associated beta strand protein